MEQENNKGSTGLQAEIINIYNSSLTTDDVKTISTGIFYENITKMKNEALDIINKKFLKFEEELIKEMNNKNISDFEKFKKPNFQSTLFEAQKAYVTTESKEMENMIIELITERIKVEEETNYQLNINAAIETIHKLNKNHIDMLTLLAIANYTVNTNWDSLSIPQGNQVIKEYLEKNVMPFTKYKLTSMDIRYLRYSGCLHDSVGEKFEEILIKKYPKLFKIIKINDVESTLVDYIISLNPEFKNIFEVYNDTMLYAQQLASVGILIGFYNAKIKINLNINLEELF